MSTIYTHMTRTALVRRQFGDCATYRTAMGNQEQLLVLACSGPLDAPEHVPAGSHRSGKQGAMAEFASR